jgi:hypothetical protein
MKPPRNKKLVALGLGVMIGIGSVLWYWSRTTRHVFPAHSDTNAPGAAPERIRGEITR